jgi:hypothetical protein
VAGGLRAADAGWWLGGRTRASGRQAGGGRALLCVRERRSCPDRPGVCAHSHLSLTHTSHVHVTRAAQVYKLPAERLYATYFGGDASQGLPADDEAKSIWLRFLPSERVLPFGCKVWGGAVCVVPARANANKPTRAHTRARCTYARCATCWLAPAGQLLGDGRPGAVWALHRDPL